ncbi:MAG: 4Fe-4S binding protein [Candidatus Heimdallarchaeum aukensis]|uniref:4Fe-4S binding protein n=1 Tax=Candidatus Heimdallarchaeum aukensis TaxID=2876573 RepID=A0A9Y1FKR7_9ARCH|nr:MAG: 4Fe-4S binding protein [Candidatus Heimdallarchaeum aukensis]
MTKNKEKNITLSLRPITNHKIRIVRIITQLVIFSLLNGLIFGLARVSLILPIEYPTGGPFSTVWSGFEALQYGLTIFTFPYLVIAIFGLFGAVAGKTTCGWACPMGLFQDLFSYIPIKKKKVSKPTEKSLRSFAVFIIIFALVFSLVIGISYNKNGSAAKDAYGIWGNIPYSVLDPVATIFATLFYYLKWGIQAETLGAEMGDWKFWFIARILFLAIILILITLYPRAYCRWFCPTGYILGFFNNFSLFGLKINKNRCPTGCNKCEKACPVQVPILDYDKNITHPNCTNCGECIDACPEGALKIGFRF